MSIALAATAMIAGCSEFGGWRDASSAPGDTSEIATGSIPAQANARLYPIETGVAAWDGALANGGMTAAHPTLPLDSWVRVTNARTGQSTMVQIDRRLDGSRGRSIELSRDAAAAVGALQNGVATVMIEPVEQLRGDASVVRGAGLPSAAPVAAPRQIPAPPAVSSEPLRTAAVSDWNPDLPTGSIPSAAAPGYAAPSFATRSAAPALGASRLDAARYLQFGSFRDPSNAQRLVDRLQAQGIANSGYGGAFVETARVNGQIFHRVRVGPLIDRSQADRALRDARSLGHQSARLVAP